MGDPLLNGDGFLFGILLIVRTLIELKMFFAWFGRPPWRSRPQGRVRWDGFLALERYGLWKDNEPDRCGVHFTWRDAKSDKCSRNLRVLPPYRASRSGAGAICASPRRGMSYRGASIGAPRAIFACLNLNFGL